MQVDFLGRLRNTRLSERHALLPLHEALANSVDAVEQRADGQGRIKITIHRDLRGWDDASAHHRAIPDISGFSITDNGIGFVRENMEAFETLDTTAKLASGGKGIGRLSWLKAFEYAEVQSLCCENGRWLRRTFEFRPTRTGIENKREETVDPPEDLAPLTLVRLHGFRPTYRRTAPKSGESVARRVIDHALEMFILGTDADIHVLDPDVGEELDLRRLFERSYQPEAEAVELEVGGHKFRVLHVLINPDGEVRHHLSFCAQRRVAETVQLTGKLRHLPSVIHGPDGNLVYAAYVTGKLLDDQVHADRTGFQIHRRGELALDGGGVTWEDLLEATLVSAESFLEPITSAAREKSIERVRTFVQERAPRYRPLLRNRPKAIADIPIEESDDKLELALHKVYTEWTHELRQSANQALVELEEDKITSVESVRRELAPLFAQLQEAAKAELAEYVLHRRSVLEFFEKMLGRQANDRFPLEEAVHDIVFPRKQTSDDVQYEDHNLWLLDERLAFHHYLSSDRPFRSLAAPVEVDSLRRPDILIFNRRLAFAEDEDALGSVVIVEFKRPEKREYSDAENPILQVLDYVAKLRDGRVTRDSGETVTLRPNVPFYCFIVASLTPKLREMADIQDLVSSPDNDGYFGYHKQRGAYIEMMSYRKVFSDAKMRNRIFFEKLGMPM